MGTHPEKLPRARLIRRRSTFTATRERGRRYTNRWMTLSVLSRDGTDQAEVAFLTPKRIGSAVMRNKLRRRLRDIYRRIPGLKVSDVHLVWISRPVAADLPFDELREGMLALLRKAALLG